MDLFGWWNLAISEIGVSMGVAIFDHHYLSTNRVDPEAIANTLSDGLKAIVRCRIHSSYCLS
jgi:hypothetical protein